MSDSEAVKVYNFWTFERGAELPPLAPFKATRDSIEKVWKGRIADGTDQFVEAAELDKLGRYRRIASGWGELA